MVPLSTVHASNASIASSHIASGTALFVGATSGLGLATLEAYAAHSKNPKIYIVARNEAKLSAIISKLKTLNPEAKYFSILFGVSILKNVDTACSTVSANESKLDLLILSPGFFKISKQPDTSDGINPVLALVFYIRMRFVYSLLPLLNAAPAARIMSIFGAGHEGQLDDNDLLLKESYNMQKATTHMATMNTLFLEQIAQKHQTISCLHVFPGTVVTPLFETVAEDWYAPFRWALSGVVLPLVRMFTIGIEEAGERLLYLATSARYPPAAVRGDIAGVGKPETSVTADGFDGNVGSGCYLLGLKGETVGNRKLLDGFVEHGWDKRVWEHTMDVFEQAGMNTFE